jgi:hypothetical protein
MLSIFSCILHTNENLYVVLNKQKLWDEHLSSKNCTETYTLGNKDRQIYRQQTET